MSNITQEQVEQSAQEIKNNITDNMVFLKQNYNILKKKIHNTKQERIFISNLEINNFIYQSPEAVNLFIDTVCFYMALEKLNVPTNLW